VVGGFELAGRLVMGVGAVVEAAVGERAAEPFVEEQEEQRNLDAFRGETVGVAGSVALEQCVTFGLVIARGAKGLFPIRVREQLVGNDVLAAIVEPLLIVWHALREQIAIFDRQMLARAHADAAARHLMTIPGVGVAVALAYTAVIDDPARFRRSASVGAYLGLTPRRYQSGEVDHGGHISKYGDGLLRAYLFEAATVLLSRDLRNSALKT
jgi:transposase